MAMLKSMANERFAMTHTTKKNNCQKKTMDQVITSLTAREYPFAAVSRALFSSCPILSHPVPSI
jgi:hypothetical protein